MILAQFLPWRRNSIYVLLNEPDSCSRSCLVGFSAPIPPSPDFDVRSLFAGPLFRQSWRLEVLEAAGLGHLEVQADLVKASPSVQLSLLAQRRRVHLQGGVDNGAQAARVRQVE